jgi:hypothetical protein
MEDAWHQRRVAANFLNYCLLVVSFRIDPSQLVGLVIAVMYRVTGLTCSFVYGMGLQPAGITTII